MNPSSMQAFLGNVNQTRAEYPTDQSLAEWIVATCRQFPENVAVSTYDGQLTYRELDQQSDHLAAVLAAKGVLPGQLVGICTERKLQTIVAMLAILKTGAGYVPLDPDYPVQRLQFMREDASIDLVLTHENLRELADSLGGRSLTVEELARETADGEGPTFPVSVDTALSPAYVIYTSGSTGKPKGVVVPHRCVVNLLSGMAESPGIAPSDVFLAMTTLSFDISVLEVFLPLTHGATVAFLDLSLIHI